VFRVRLLLHRKGSGFCAVVYSTDAVKILKGSDLITFHLISHTSSFFIQSLLLPFGPLQRRLVLLNPPLHNFTHTVILSPMKIKRERDEAFLYLLLQLQSPFSLSLSISRLHLDIFLCPHTLSILLYVFH
jgi:hypothetical protein